MRCGRREASHQVDARTTWLPGAKQDHVRTAHRGQDRPVGAHYGLNQYSEELDGRAAGPDAAPCRATEEDVIHVEGALRWPTSDII